MTDTKKILTEIKNWKLEAKLEDTERYFFHTSIVEEIKNGEKCYVIGRKGTGKTAISEHLFKTKKSKQFAKKLTFKNFPFNDLYQNTNASYSAPNQYITFWKYLIYSSIAQQMVGNENINSDIREKLSKIYDREPSRSLPRTIKQWISGDLDFKILGTGSKIGLSRSSSENNMPWIERVEILEDIIEKNIDDSKYLIIFDELDEDYKDIIEINKYKQYTDLLTSLFKAVQDIKSIFPSEEFSIFPVIFLRDDIYDLLKDPDKTKWTDLIVEIEWNTQTIKDLLAFRLTRALDRSLDTIYFNKIWDTIFVNQKVGYGHKQQKKMSIFEYITRSTHIRPRDFVRFLQVCAINSQSNYYKKLSPDAVIDADTTFSNYFRSELEDEIHGVLPDISAILDVLAEIKKQTFTYQTFIKSHTKKLKEGTIITKDPEFILKILFNFSIIGNQPRQKNTQIFRYIHRNARFSTREASCIHRGLFKALQII